MIRIQGLNKKQRALADIMWAMDGREQVLAFIHALHPKDRQEAETVCELMIWAFFDQVDSIDDSVRELLDRIRQN